MRIRTKLALGFFSVALIPLAAIGYYSTSKQSDALHQFSDHEAEGIAKNLAKTIVLQPTQTALIDNPVQVQQYLTNARRKRKGRETREKR